MSNYVDFVKSGRKRREKKDFEIFLDNSVRCSNHRWIEENRCKRSFCTEINDWCKLSVCPRLREVIKR